MLADNIASDDGFVYVLGTALKLSLPSTSSRQWMPTCNSDRVKLER